MSKLEDKIVEIAPEVVNQVIQSGIHGHILALSICGIACMCSFVFLYKKRNILKLETATDIKPFDELKIALSIGVFVFGLLFMVLNSWDLYKAIKYPEAYAIKKIM